jgi:hypothetical protein
MKHVILILCGLVLLLPSGTTPGPGPGPGPQPENGDVFDQFAEDLRGLTADNWMEMATKEFDDEQKKLEWINTRNKAAREAAWAPVHDLAARAADSGPEFVARFATSLKERTLGHGHTE